MDGPGPEFARRFHASRRVAFAAAVVETLPVAAGLAALAALLAPVGGLASACLPPAAFLAGAAAGLRRAPATARRLDRRLGLADRVATAREVSKGGGGGVVGALLVLDAGRSLASARAFAPDPPSARARVLALAVAAVFGFSPYLRALRDEGAVAPDPVEAHRAGTDPTVGPPSEPGSADPALVSESGGTAAPRGAGALPSVDPGGSGGGEEASLRPIAGARESGPAPPSASAVGLVPRPVPIEAEKGPKRRKEAWIFEFPDERAGTAAPRRVRLEEALPAARARAAESVRRATLAPGEEAFVGLFFERLRP